MNDIDIYNLATEVISAITSEMNESWYEPLDGKLTVSWRTKRKFNAWASSDFKSGGAPVHRVGMYYELARQLYRDIDDYCSYIESGLDQKNFDFWFQDDPVYGELLPSDFSKEDYRKNMFLSGLTWVFFHEIGHLNQEHGVLRGNESFSGVIHEADVNRHKKLEGRESAIYHATELSADFEATSKTLMELVRHFNGKELESSVYLFVCGLSCVLYRFNGAEQFEPEETPKGSHPKPLIRLESIIPIIYETLDLTVRDIAGVTLGRRELVCMCSRASNTVGLYWLRAHANKPGIPDNYFLEGILNKPGVREYMARIVEVWDELESTVHKNKHYGSPLEVLQFTSTYRELISGSCELPGIPA